MPINAFLHAVKQLAENRLDALAVVGAAENLNTTGSHDLAVQLYQLWIASHQTDPLLSVAYYNLGMSLAAAGNSTNARQALEQALAINPHFHPARINLGVLSASAGDTGQALGHWAAVAEFLANVSPENLRYKKLALRHQTHHFEQLHRYAEADACLRQSLELDCHQTDLAQHWLALRQEQCLWPIVTPLHGLSCQTLLRDMLPLSLAAYTDDPVLQLASSWNHMRSIQVPKEAASSVPANAGARRRIAYLSSDLRAHAVGYLVPEVFELHDKNEFEVFAYYCGPPSSAPLHLRLRDAVEHWVDVTGMDDTAAARRIAEDGIDILVDLNGHTRDSRTAVVARRPAPIIVNWLGYPGTMGSPHHHYIIADDWIIPESHEAYYSEKVLRLACYQPNDRKKVAAPPPQSRAEFGLPENATVYCCFNSAHKITPFTFERWMRILKEVPDSVLWLFEVATATSERLRSLAQEHNVDPERLFFAPKRPNPEHLARYSLADLFLDTAPYGAHTTASDALWMGVPVLTLSGQSFASRVCGSLVRAAGLPELVCTTPESYVERAVALGRDRQELARLKERLRLQRDTCILFDMNRHVRELEALYRRMWDDLIESRLPVPNLANLDIYLDIGVEATEDRMDVLAIPDHRDWYRERVAHRHHWTPIPDDGRFWSTADNG